MTPGARTILLAHNAYPDHGKYEDRLDRAIATGVPFVVEEDLAWIDGKSLLIHGAKNASGEDPTLESYFFPKIKPLIEKALQERNKGNWPVVTLYLDIKNDPPEHLQAINAILDRYQDWLTTAVKTDDLSKQSPLRLRPMMVLVEDKQNDIKQKFFYDDLPVGGAIRVFGSVTKPAENPNHLPKQEYIDSLASVPPEQIVTGHADNYHRWWGLDWSYVEKGGEEHSNAWSAEKDARLKQFVRYGHKLGYLMSFYCLDGFTQDNNQGWEAEYNFGSPDAVMPRWKAAIHAKADFISSDDYEHLSHEIQQGQ
uniref:Uncharacterized protein n=1 Tax=Paracidobacterium acidisoli TaxID=2303751 RepID=A0A372IRZ3_9BACT